MMDPSQSPQFDLGHSTQTFCSKEGKIKQQLKPHLYVLSSTHFPLKKGQHSHFLCTLLHKHFFGFPIEGILIIKPSSLSKLLSHLFFHIFFTPKNMIIIHFHLLLQANFFIFCASKKPYAFSQYFNPSLQRSTRPRTHAFSWHINFLFRYINCILLLFFSNSIHVLSRLLLLPCSVLWSARGNHM